MSHHHFFCLALIVLHTVCKHTIYHHFYTVAGSVFGILTVAVLALALALCTRWVFQVSKVNAFDFNVCLCQ